MKVRPYRLAPLFSTLGLLMAPFDAALAAERHWAYLAGCASADWLGLPQSQATCWASQAGGAPGALPPAAGDAVFLLNDRATAELLTPLVASSRAAPFAATAQSLEARGSAQFATGLLVDRGTLSLQRLSLGSALGQAAQRGRLQQSGGRVSVGIVELQHGDYLLQAGNLSADSMLLRGPQPLFDQRGGFAQFGGVDLVSPLAAGSARLQHSGGSLSIERLTLQSERDQGAVVQASASSDAQIDRLRTLGGGGSVIELGSGARWRSQTATLAESEFGSASLRMTGGAQWTVRDQFVLGAAGFANAELSGGAQLHTRDSWLAASSTSVASLVLRGQGTYWGNDGELIIGRQRSGTVQLLDGATARSAAFTLGRDSGASGLLDLAGSGTHWAYSGMATIGGFGEGALAVNAGALLEGTAAGFGQQPGGAGRAVVQGEGARWLLSGIVVLGGVGSGQLVVGPGGLVEAGSLWAGNNGQVQLAGGTLVLNGGVTLAPGGSFVWQAGLLRLLSGDQQLGQGALPTALALDGSRSLELAGRLRLPAGSVLLLAGGGLQAAALDLDGGVIVGDAQGRLSLDAVPLLRGAGTVAVAISGGSSRLQRIEATGPLSLGLATRRDAIAMGGELWVGAQRVSLLDADLAELSGRVFMDTGGQLSSLNGIHLQGGAALFSRGNASVQGRFVNDGRVGTEGGQLLFTDAVSGVGSFAGAVRFLADYTPGPGAAEVDFRGGWLSLGPQARLVLDVSAGGQDRLVHIELLQADGSLVLDFGAGLDGGGHFDLFDFTQLSGSFSQVVVQGVPASRVDLSRLLLDGSVSVAAVPEPATVLLWAGGLVLLTLRRQASRQPPTAACCPTSTSGHRS